MAKIAVAPLVIGLLALAGAAGWWYYAANKSPEALHRKVVLAYLNDPDSAQFRGAYQSKRDQVVWCGEVNAKNRMGGMVGFTRYVVDGSRREVHFDAPNAIGDEAKAAAATLEGKWRIYCE
jgi:hypothetical protein